LAIDEPQRAVRTPKRFGVPRIAEMVADDLRAQILNGELAEGAMLPRQEDLVKEFGISLPSLREALRILETEGLISVRRGNAGAVVHRPSAQSAAFMLGVVLRSHNVVVSDLAAALQVVEPACAALCAQHPAHTQIAERLRELTDTAAQHVNDGEGFTLSAREFHDELARSCGIETLRQVIGTLESLWSDYEAYWARENSRKGSYPSAEDCKLVLKAHRAVTKAIADGNHQAAERAAKHHLKESQKVLLADAGDTPLSAVPVTRGAGQPGQNIQMVR
jgi:DNA-binding FadR family transcriptional regulator